MTIENKKRLYFFVYPINNYYNHIKFHFIYLDKEELITSQLINQSIPNKKIRGLLTFQKKMTKMILILIIVMFGLSLIWITNINLKGHSITQLTYLSEVIRHFIDVNCANKTLLNQVNNCL